ncbi:hypothetical protein CHISP_3125 [Chitinispirillum alkaliphilum]|nr:hypothetical protein CHISP_3125 [Chitinispirillum alkaliphilum]
MIETLENRVTVFEKSAIVSTKILSIRFPVRYFAPKGKETTVINRHRRRLSTG